MYQVNVYGGFAMRKSSVLHSFSRKIAWVWVMGIAFAQPYAVGDRVGDFTAPLCANDEGEFRLYDYNGDENGGRYSVIWINFFASW